MAQNLTIINKLKDYFEKDKEHSANILEQLTLYIYQIESNKSKSDLYILAKLLTKEDLVKIVDYFDGDLLKIPTKEEFKICALLAFCFYLKEIQGKDWVEIQEIIGLPENNLEWLSSISVGRQINNIKEHLNNDICSVIKGLELDDAQKDFDLLKIIMRFEKKKNVKRKK